MSPEKYRDRLHRAALDMVEANRTTPEDANVFTTGSLAFLAAVDEVIAEMDEDTLLTKRQFRALPEASRRTIASLLDQRPEPPRGSAPYRKAK